MSNIVKFTPSETLMQLRKCTTVELCLSSDTPALSELKKENGEDKVLTLLEMWILDINEYFNVNNKMKPNQIKEASILLMQDFYYFKISDINYIFSNAKKGRYGNLYGSLDGSKVYQWFCEHDNERAGACYKTKLKEHSILRSEEINAASPRLNNIGKENTED